MGLIIVVIVIKPAMHEMCALVAPNAIDLQKWVMGKELVDAMGCEADVWMQMEGMVFGGGVGVEEMDVVAV